MKIKIYKMFPILLVITLGGISCKKNGSDTVSNETDRVYFPSARGASNLFSVLDSGAVVLDTGSNTINIPLRLLRGGFLKHENFTVDVSVDSARVKSLIQLGLLPANTIVIPSDVYSIPSKDTLSDSNFLMQGNLITRLNKQKVLRYPGKTMALAVKILNPSKFEINNDLSTVVFFFDVDKLLDKVLPVTLVPISIKNPGFNDNPYANGWTQTGNGWGTEGGLTGNALHYYTNVFPANATTLQTVNNLANGNYTVNIYYKLAGINIFLYANGAVKPLIAAGYGAYTKLGLDFQVTNNTATFGIQVINGDGNRGSYEPYFDVDDFSVFYKKR